MNERILELADKAAEGISGDLNIPDEFCEKFAELIVMKCLTICEELGDKGMDGHYCADEINKTFRN